MSTMKSFAAITGVHPFSLNRSSCVIAFSIAALVIAKLVDAYLFCGFNQNVFVDLPIGVILFFGYCITPLLGLAVNRKPTTRGGRCCRMFAIVLVCSWQFLTVIAALVLFELQFITINARSNDHAAYDPLNVCGNRTFDNVRAQFRNSMPTLDIFQRIDMIFKIAVALGWLVLMQFPMLQFLLFLKDSITETSRNHQACENTESGKPAEENDEAIVWMEESSEGKTEQPSAIAEHGSMDIEDESAPDDAAQEAGDRKSEVGSVNERMENHRNEANEPGSNAEPQSKEANEPEFSIVNEEEETTTKATNEDSK